jgi:hypothetical protein
LEFEDDGLEGGVRHSIFAIRFSGFCCGEIITDGKMMEDRRYMKGQYQLSIF